MNASRFPLASKQAAVHKRKILQLLLAELKPQPSREQTVTKTAC